MLLSLDTFCSGYGSHSKVLVLFVTAFSGCLMVVGIPSRLRSRAVRKTPQFSQDFRYFFADWPDLIVTVSSESINAVKASERHVTKATSSTRPEGKKHVSVAARRPQRITAGISK